MNSNDKRVIRTRQSISRAVCNLMVEHDYNQITVSDIAREAGIDRKTFYLHYASKEQLFQEWCERATDIFITLLIPLFSSEDGTAFDFKVKSMAKMVEPLKGLAQEGPAYQRIIIQNQSYHFIIDAVCDALVDHLHDYIVNRVEIDERLACVYSQAAVAALAKGYMTWMMEDDPIPIEDFAQLTYDYLIDLHDFLLAHAYKVVDGKPTNINRKTGTPKAE